MTTLLIAAIAVIKFDGGTPSEFATVLADNLKQNVVVSLGQPRIIEKASFETTDADVMSREIRSQTKLVMQPGSELVFSDDLLDRDRVRSSQQLLRRARSEAEAQFEVVAPPPPSAQRMDVSFVGLPAKAVADGKVTVKTEKSEGLQIKMLEAGLGKPVEVHWIYEQTPVFANVKDMPVLEFTKWVARAIGAKAVAGEKSYRFELDAQEIRKRAVATIRAEPIPTLQTGQPNEAEQARTFRISCINALTTKQVSDALASPGSSVVIVMTPQSQLARSAIQRIRQVEQTQLGYGPTDRRPRNAIGLLQRIDNSRPATLVIDAQFGVTMEIPVLDQNGRSAGTVRL